MGSKKFKSFKSIKAFFKFSKEPLSPTELSAEIYGLVVFSIGVLGFLSILTYYQTDPIIGELAGDNRYLVKNFLGIAGATISKPIFQGTFGYPSLIFPFLVMLWGIALMIEYPLEKLLRVCMVSIAWAYLFSVIMAAPEALKTRGDSSSYFPSGLLGGITADLITRFLGKFALCFITFVFFLILAVLTFNIRLSNVPKYLIQKLSGWVNQVVESFKNIQWFPKKAENSSEVKVEKSALLGFLNIPKKPKASETTEEIPVQTEEEEEEKQNAPFAEIETEAAFPPDDESEAGKQDEIPLNTAPENEMESAQAEEAAPEEEPSEDAVEIITENGDEGSVKTMFPLEDGDTDEGEKRLRIDADLSLENKPELPSEDYEVLLKRAMKKYKFPETDLLFESESNTKISREELMANADLLENTLAQFGVKASVKKVIEGPVITLYAVRPAEGVKINQIVSLSDDLALAMRAKGIRMIAPIPGEAAIGIEIPNRRPSTVYFKSIVQSEKFIKHKGNLVLGMGKTIGGEVFCADLTRMPHLLVAGATGAGKSVGINTMIASILYRVPPGDVKFVMIDPKKLELSLYARLKDHYLATCPELDEIVITHPQNAVLILRSVVNEMEERYDQLARLGVRDIIAYNTKIQKLKESGEKTEELRKLPYLIVIIDELADLILTASREVEEPITRLAQMARAVGIHLVVATQRPSVDILTGLIKANFPTRIAYQVATRPDSKVILDMHGAEKLIGQGDLLFLPPGTGKPIRLQNPYISTEEVDEMIKYIRKQPKFPPYELKLVRAKQEGGSPDAKRMLEQDDLFEQAKEIVVRHQQGSISLLQRKLKVGYARAARLIDELEEAGVVGPGQGSKARDVLVSAYGGD